MSNSYEKPHKPEGSIKQAIAKRKTQEILRTIEDKKIAEAHGDSTTGDFKRHRQSLPVTRTADRTSKTHSSAGDLPRSADPRRTTQIRPNSADPRRTTRVAAAINPEYPSVLSPIYSLSRSQKRLLIAGIASMLCLIVCLVTFLAITNQPASAAPLSMLPPLPVVSAADVIAQLKKVHEPIVAEQGFSAATNLWLARDEIQFNVLRGDKKGTFIVMSYSSPADKGPDLFRLSLDSKFVGWDHTSLANITLLISPDSAPEIRNEIESHIKQFLLAPYRPFLATATPEAT